MKRGGSGGDGGNGEPTDGGAVLPSPPPASSPLPLANLDKQAPPETSPRGQTTKNTSNWDHSSTGGSLGSQAHDGGDHLRSYGFNQRWKNGSGAGSHHNNFGSRYDQERGAKIVILMDLKMIFGKTLMYYQFLKSCDTKVRQLTTSIDLILDTLRLSTIVEVQGDKVRKREDWINWVLPPSNISSQSPATLNSDNLAAHLQSVGLEGAANWSNTRIPNHGERFLSRSASGNLSNQLQVAVNSDRDDTGNVIGLADSDRTKSGRSLFRSDTL
ncbi:hypothetical protein B296_00009191 [Ensete ventricosum]|uniref:Uncharacterized protein n=1 Tax=Ensete ventricosum TaxID=4639 RepID=A0A427ARB7_ENSVE|nr:hypothetical protein B296_00009191 [Ensete ventricosum]